MPFPAQPPGIGRRLASMLYESLLLAAVLFVASFAFLAFSHDATTPVARPLFQAYLVSVAALYFTWFWRHGGQTLPMKTWKLRLVSSDGQAVSLQQACLRFALALLGLALGISIVWAWFDRDRQFLHDRLAKTRVISTD